MVDIDEKVVSACREYLPRHHQGAFSDPRTQLIFTDAYSFLLEIDNQFDVAIIDVPDPIEAGPSHKLFTEEFYSILLDRLGENGIMVVQSGPTDPTSYKECFTAVVNTVGHVFPTSSAYHAFVPAFGSTWGSLPGPLGDHFWIPLGITFGSPWALWIPSRTIVCITLEHV